MRKKIFCLVVVLCLGVTALADEGNGSGGGGNALRRGSYWRVADAAYQAPSYRPFVFDAGLRAQISAIREELRDIELLPGLEDFFDTQIYGANVEYRLVNELPKNCRFVDDSDVHGDSAETNVHIGCTFGSVTYLLEPAIQEALQTKNYLELALLIFHERLFPFAKNQQGYEVISEFVQGVRLLMVHHQPVRRRFLDWLTQKPSFDSSSDWVRNPPRVFTDEQLEIVNRLPSRVEQLTGKPLPVKFYGRPNEVFYLTPWGGLYNRYADVGAGVKLGMGAMVRGGKLSGQDIVVVDSYLDDARIDGQRIQIVATRITGRTSTYVSGSDIRIWASAIGNISLSAQDFTLDHSQWDNVQHVSGIGRGIVFRDSVMGDPHWSCNDYTKKEHRFEKDWWLHSVLGADRLVIEHKVIDVNCTISDKQ